MARIPLRHVRIHGHDVGYRLAGHGPTIVLIHGLAGSSRTWRDVMPALAERHTVLAPDLLGHGESAKPMGDYSLGAHASGLRDLLGVLGISRATIVGQSFGGGIAMQLAYQHPEIVERLVLVGSGGLGREVSWLLRVFTLPGAEYLMPVLFPSFLRDRGNDAARLLHRLGLRAPQAAENWRAYSSLTGAENRHAFVRTVRTVIEPRGQAVSARDRLYLAAATPTLIVWGDADPIIPVAHAYAAHDAMPGSRLEIFEGVGHFPHSEAPDRFVNVLTDFLASTEPASRDASTFRDLLVAASDVTPTTRLASATGDR
ncbi:MAG TPA: alpha/beta fold hydrolase [Acidimicrobiia bacterium]|nr:alpha/beta fold hydrolase [Acidimicrobiia bacterium]